MKKKVSFIICLITFVLSIYSPVYALDESVQSIVKIENGVLSGYEKLLQYAGMLIDPVLGSSRATVQFVKDRLIALGLLNSGASDEDVQDFFDDNLNQNGNNIGFSSNLYLYIDNEIQSIISESPYFYAYTCNVKLRPTDFSSGDSYRAWNSFISSYQDQYYIFRVGNYFYLYPFNNDIAFVYGSPRSQYAYIYTYDFNGWDQIVWGDMYKCFLYDSTNYEFNEVSSPHSGYAAGGFVINDYNSIDGSPISDTAYQWMISFGKNILIKVYRSVNDMKDANLGISSYYITDSYNDFVNTSGSYNTTTTDNSVTYGDITNYINNYYGDNGSYPTPEQIKIQIEIIQDSGSGGGTGGGTGGGSGGDGSSIWDFLSNLGEVLGGLIKNLGNMLTSLIDSIISIINDVIGKIPDVFSNLLGIVFGGLPEDLRAIIILGVTVMVIYGIIKVIRG